VRREREEEERKKMNYEWALRCRRLFDSINRCQGRMKKKEVCW
jgi:hypothetical protein